MKVLSFQQDPGLSSDTLILNETRLVVSSKAMGLSMEKMLELTEMSPEYERIEQRFWHLYITPLVFMVAMSLLAWWLIGQKSEFAIVALSAVLFSFWLVFEGFHPVETAIFSSRDGKKLVEIYRPRKVTLAKRAKPRYFYKSGEPTIGYYEFVTALSDRIKANASNARPEQSK